eukprot:1554284-Rhodomonas_salina.2
MKLQIGHAQYRSLPAAVEASRIMSMTYIPRTHFQIFFASMDALEAKNAERWITHMQGNIPSAKYRWKSWRYLKSWCLHWAETALCQDHRSHCCCQVLVQRKRPLVICGPLPLELPRPVP